MRVAQHTLMSRGLLVIVLLVSGLSRLALGQAHGSGYTFFYNPSVPAGAAAYEGGTVELESSAGKFAFLATVPVLSPIGVCPLGLDSLIVAWELPGGGGIIERHAVGRSFDPAADRLLFSRAADDLFHVFGVDPYSLQMIRGSLVEVQQGGTLFSSDPIGTSHSLAALAWHMIGSSIDYLDVRSDAIAWDFSCRPFPDPSGSPRYFWSLELDATGNRSGIHFIPSSATSGYSIFAHDLDHPRATLVTSSVVHGSTQIEASAPPGALVEFLIEGLPAGAVSASAGGRARLPVPGLHVGDVVVARIAGSTDDSMLRANVIYRNPAGSTSSSFAEMPRPSSHFIGNEDFIYRVGLRTPVMGPEDFVEISGLALAGLAPQSNSGADPVIITPGGDFLLDITQASLLPVNGFTSKEGIGWLEFRAPIPADPNLVDLVMFVQFAFDDGAGIVYSHIVGFSLFQL